MTYWKEVVCIGASQRFWRDLSVVFRRNWYRPHVVLAFIIARGIFKRAQEITFRRHPCRGCNRKTHWRSDVDWAPECPRCNDKFWDDYEAACRKAYEEDRCDVC